MNEHTSRRSRQALCALGLSIALSGACGGRAITVDDGSPAGAAGTLGAGASAGAGATGGKPSGGTGSGGKAGSASAGAPSAGAGNNCGFTGCPAIACGAGATLITPPGACCPICECSQQACPDLACPSGYQLQAQPGQCCPSCVPNPMIDCATGQQHYLQFRDMLLGKYAYGCQTNADCVAVAPSNRCESGCSYVAVWSTVLNDLNSNLASDAMTDCAACSPTPVPPCLPPSEYAACYGGQCVLQQTGIK